MHAVIRTGGRQYRVAEGDVIAVERLPGGAGDTVTFDQVLMLSDGNAAMVGAPLVEDAVVEGMVAEQTRAPKVLVFKKIRRKNHRRRQGHRQHLTVVRITGIRAPDGAWKAPSDPEPAPAGIVAGETGAAPALAPEAADGDEGAKAAAQNPAGDSPAPRPTADGGED